MRAIRGFSIGGQASAGGSTFYAGMKEQTFLASLPQHIAHELLTKTLMVRWLDDLLHVYPRDLTRAASRAIDRMQRRDFYGGTLELLRTSSTVAFGFWVQARHGRLLVRERFTYTRDIEESACASSSVWPLVPPVWQFGVMSTNYNTMIGRYIRHLDTTNGMERDVLWGLRRISAELIQADFPVELMNKAIKQISLNANLDLKPILDFHQLPKYEISLWAHTYDAFISKIWQKSEHYSNLHDLVVSVFQH